MKQYINPDKSKTFREKPRPMIADNSDHLVHFNGDKFLGPYKD